MIRVQLLVLLEINFFLLLLLLPLLGLERKIRISQLASYSRHCLSYHRSFFRRRLQLWSKYPALFLLLQPTMSHQLWTELIFAGFRSNPGCFEMASRTMNELFNRMDGAEERPTCKWALSKNELCQLFLETKRRMITIDRPNTEYRCNGLIELFNEKFN